MKFICAELHMSGKGQIGEIMQLEALKYVVGTYFAG